MPEYLAPGVYVEETSFRSKSLEGVSTSTAGFIGPTRYGPASGDPELLTSFLDFQRIFGGLDDLELGGARQPNYLAHAVRAFFEEGGRRLFVTRVFGFTANAQDDNGVWTKHYGRTDTGSLSPALGNIVLHARFPGAAGNMRVTLTLKVGANALNAGPAGGSPSLTRVSSFDVVHVATPIVTNGRTTGWFPRSGTDGLFLAAWDAQNERWILAGNGSDVLLTDLAAGTSVRPLSVTAEVAQPEVGSTGFKTAELLGEPSSSTSGPSAPP